MLNERSKLPQSVKSISGFQEKYDEYSDDKNKSYLADDGKVGFFIND